jgi:putative nucleotidyltransferase with HDIG domain
MNHENEVLRDYIADEVIEAFLEALNQKEKELAGHNQRVAELAVRLGREMGLSEQEMTVLRRGAMLHDIGKISIPEHILNKPGKLTEEEYEIVKAHTLLGASILRHMSFMRQAAVIAESHHERWDGTGYPHSLHGSEIPLLARISAVAGTFDALTSERSYKPAWSKAEALAFISKEAGKAYDPQVVSVLLGLM